MAKFKIGDRVFDTASSGKNCAVVKDVNGSRITIEWEAMDGLTGEWSDTDFELVTPFTIEPGKHYRTRSGKPTGRVTKGDTGFEAVVDGRVRIFDDAGGAVHSDDHIVEPWVPKVGERVRYSGKCIFYNEEELVGLEGTVTDVGSELVNVKWDRDVVRGIPTSGAKYLANVEPLPVAAPQPAALKIEAGRYYKTRDGRKVGPIKYSGFGTFGAEGFSDREWYENGRVYTDTYRTTEKDLIAEWVDEPTAHKPVAAQVDASAEEYGPVVAKPKFKVGDRVRILDGCPYILTESQLTGEIIGRTTKTRGDWKVHLDNYGSSLGFYERELSFAAPTTTAIVALIEDGQPKPADRPYVHRTEEAAAQEAKRLAGLHKGKQFGVFVLTTTAAEAKPVYRHEWQRLAADGRKIDAIKELRSLTGMTLKPAKDVVEGFLDHPYGQAA